MTTLPDTDAFVRFAKAHLPSKTERTIYPVLAGAPDRDWAAGEVAAAAGVSHHEADQALRRFASAGIVHHRVRGQSHRYRWHPDMGYLRQGDVSGPAIDPVCGMPVPPGTPHTARDDDTEIRFCSLPCLVRWRSDRHRRRATR